MPSATMAMVPVSWHPHARRRRCRAPDPKRRRDPAARFARRCRARNAARSPRRCERRRWRWRGARSFRDCRAQRAAAAHPRSRRGRGDNAARPRRSACARRLVEAATRARPSAQLATPADASLRRAAPDPAMPRAPRWRSRSAQELKERDRPEYSERMRRSQSSAFAGGEGARRRVHSTHHAMTARQPSMATLSSPAKRRSQCHPNGKAAFHGRNRTKKGLRAAEVAGTPVRQSPEQPIHTG